ncbi:unnamed protein product [Nesidiocoris tenuis]|uniref:Uncharacterized protein n=1 Tax=Nesidiocoris tenuis TaxID=355587 RepID=A0A6H5HPD3_9HEMI|nr:unnamed protein product [Nesidiocoris tenuis]
MVALRSLIKRSFIITRIPLPPLWVQNMSAWSDELFSTDRGHKAHVHPDATQGAGPNPDERDRVKIGRNLEIELELRIFLTKWYLLKTIFEIRCWFYNAVRYLTIPQYESFCFFRKLPWQLGIPGNVTLSLLGVARSST